MESLYANQIEISEFLTKLLTNFKKDGAERKTIDYCKRRLGTLEGYWVEFQRNHRKILEFDILDHEYFTGNCFGTTEGLYLTIHDLIMKTIDQLSVKQKLIRPEQQISEEIRQFPKLTETDQPGTSPKSGPGQQQPYTSSGGYSKLDELIKKQTINFRAFMRTVNSIEVDQLENKWEFEDTLKSLLSRWSTIDSLHWEIESESDGEDRWYQKEFNQYEKVYVDLKKTINTKMWSVSHREKSTPQMDIPVFSGSYHHWVSFKDLFYEAIHNNPSLSNAQKMQFLKSKLTGDAERLIHHLQISSDNYNVCWDILNHRYDNKKLIFTCHINTLLGLPHVQNQSSAMIKKLHDVTKESLHAIQNLGVDIKTWDPLLVHLLGQKLDSESFAEYVESIKNPRELPVLQEFLSFLECKFTALEASRRRLDHPNQQKLNSVNLPRHTTNNLQSYHKKQFNSNYNYHPSFTRHNNNNIKPNMNTFHVSRSMTCVLCNAVHGLWQCSKFLQMSNELKLNTINQFNLCRNCLTNHNNKACFSSKRCRKCLGTHNTLMHEALRKYNPVSMSMTPKKLVQNIPQTEPMPGNSHVSWGNELSEILLATAMVKVMGANGTYYTMRALIDQGSQISIISENTAQTLGLKRNQCKGKIFGVGEKENHCKGTMNVEISSIYNDFSINANVFIMNSLIKSLPNKTFSKPLWSHIQNINLADPKFNESRPVDLLLGAELYSKIMLGGIIRGDDENQPIAQQTQFGWLLCGSIKPYYRCNVVLHNIDELRRFWENEEISQPNEMSCDDHECLQYFLSTTKRLENGRYEVRLPFKSHIKNQLGATNQLALAQFRNLEKKFEKNIQLKTDYQQFMNEYRDLNHMTPSTYTTPEYYLPHHAVTKKGSPSNKFRVVFNASAKSSSGTTLNDTMFTGPNLQQDLQELMLKWRQYRYVYTADIEKMFRQILVHKEDQVYQKVVWRDSPTQPIQIFQLTTVTYGTKPAPFLAMMCLKQLAKDEQSDFPVATKMLENSFYMDDYCGGSHTIENALLLKSDLIELLKRGGFNLRKWQSNERKLLLDVEMTECDEKMYQFKQPDTAKTLGLGWNPQTDQFYFSQLQLESKSGLYTKRSLLSDISKLFDPLGWLSPLSTTMKLLFRDVYVSKVEWDEPLPGPIMTKWDNIKQDLDLISTIEVKRWLGLNNAGQIIQLHGFCDASDKAYACVIYCRVRQHNEHTITLVAAKSRLASISKTISTPRLELLGAVLLSSLMKKVLQCLLDYHIEVYGWIDSTAVLGWLQGEPARWKPFVANRVKSITSIIPSTSWRYVKTKENPADCASRGLTAKQLKTHELWWQGPSWLPSFEIEQTSKTIYKTDLDVKTSFFKQTNLVTMDKDNDIISNIIIRLLDKFSSINKIIRIFAWILRLSTYRRSGRQPYLTLHELRHAKMLIIKYIQQSVFAQDFDYLNRHNKVHSRSKILNLKPIRDINGILRVGGRLSNAQINHNMKHPIILPHNHRLTILLIKEAHELTFHGGARLTLSYLRHKYWIIGGYMATKKYIRRCVQCKKQEPMIQSQLMGDLPEARVNPECAFHHCGVDYTGFIDVKANRGRGIKTCKGYIAIFICMVTKAVHIELVSDLTSSAFLAALQRMAARRGVPRHLYSDNGTNFVGANRMLHEEFQCLLQLHSNSDFLSEITEMGIEWHFNAPSWPNAGGLWERAVRSLKYHLKRVIGHQKLTYEEYTTLLSKVEACLNSRPLCALTEDPEDLDFLTPAHFLTGRPGLTIIETAQDARTRWNLTTKLFQDLWKRWKTEYLTTLSARSKWKDAKSNIEIGDLVVIHEENIPPGRWAMGRVIERHPGNDGLIRVVTLKTLNGIIKRPIVKLSVLPVNNNPQSVIHTTTPSLSQTSSEEEEEPRKEIKRGKRNKSKKSTFAALATALLFFMTLLLPANAIYHIKELSSYQTLYFDPITNAQLIRDKWNLVLYYNMEPYWEAIKSYSKISSYLDKQCTTIDNHSHCHIINLQLHNEFEELKYYNELLLNQHFNVPARRQRRRRGFINGIGYLANDLFGVLDSRFAEQYIKDIETIRRNEKHLSDLWKNQTSIVETEFAFMQNMRDFVDKQHKFINKKLNELQSYTNTVQQEIKNISSVQDFTLSAMAASGLLQGLRRLQDSFLKTITDIYHGHVSVYLLKPEQLKDELRIIYGRMPREVSLPITNIDSDFQYIYQLLKVKARVTDQYIIFEITFPLVSRESYQLYKILPVPQQVESSMVTIVPISEYVAVNLKQGTYFLATISELSACLFHKKTYLCQLSKPIMVLERDECFCDKSDQNHTTCKIKKSACANRWIELHAPTQYLYFCCDNYSIRIICNDEVTVKQLTRAGVISMDQDCVVKGKDFTLHSLQLLSNQLNYSPTILTPELDQINHLINLTIPDLGNLPDNQQLNTSLTLLGDQIKTLKSSKAEVDDISIHDVHHYTSTYVLLILGLIAVAVWYWKKRRCSRQTQPATTLRRREEDHGHQVEVTEPRPVLPTPVYSEVSRPPGANDLRSSEINNSVRVRLQSFAKRWPSVTRNVSASTQDKQTSPIPRKPVTVEDSLV